MNIYDEAIESIEGLPHTMKVPLRRVLKRAKKVEELLELYRKAHLDVLNGELAEEINLKEKELEALK